MGIDILIPVLGRPQVAQTLFDSAAVTREPYRLIFICSPNDPDEIEACKATTAETWIVEWTPGPADYGRKINWGYEHSQAEWIFQGADDIRFSPGWDTEALQVAHRQDKSVIGTNDLHNPAVRRHMESTHSLFARSYIEEQGGTHDGTGKVLCELYDHQYVDTEFIETARRRGAFAFAVNSIVEHLHPHWGLSEMDPTYKKATRRTGQDRRLYIQRMGMPARAARINARIEERAERRRLRNEALRARRGQ